MKKLALGKNMNFPPVPSKEEIDREAAMQPHALAERIEKLEKTVKQLEHSLKKMRVKR